MKVNNAIIMAAGTASRFAPLSYEIPKALVEVRGEVLIERQINQLIEAGITEVVIVTGYKAEQFEYLRTKYGVELIYNPDYLTRNNNSSIWIARNYIRNSYICSADNYFINNPFTCDVDDSYYASIYIEGETNEWCIKEVGGHITNVEIGGKDSWIMLGHVFWSEMFSRKFISILENEYNLPETANKLWETIHIEHIDELDMKIKKYSADSIFEFDTLDELRAFDTTYVTTTRSSIIKYVAEKIGVKECDINNLRAVKDNNNEAVGFSFEVDKNKKQYIYYYKSREVEGLS